MKEEEIICTRWKELAAGRVQESKMKRADTPAMSFSLVHIHLF